MEQLHLECVGPGGKEYAMKNSAPFSSFRKVILSCFLWSDRIQAQNKIDKGYTNNFPDLYGTVHDAHDQEMERLVRAIEKTRDDSFRYQ
jgi:hypothetical protein